MWLRPQKSEKHKRKLFKVNSTISRKGLAGCPIYPRPRPFLPAERMGAVLRAAGAEVLHLGADRRRGQPPALSMSHV